MIGQLLSLQVSAWLAVCMILLAAFLGMVVTALTTASGHAEDLSWRDMPGDLLHERAHAVLGLPPPADAAEDIFGDPAGDRG